MNKNELMHGDWVQSSDGLTAYQIGIHDVSEEIKPIPLSLEMLGINGIQYQYGNPWVQWGGYPDMDRFEFNYDNHGTTLVKICVDYVHELQHILRLCGLVYAADNFNPIGGEAA